MNFDELLLAELREVAQRHLLRKLRVVEQVAECTLRHAAKEVINFASNDYLGLASEPFLKEIAARAARDFGAGSGSARLISGTLPVHQELEDCIARFKRTEAALAFACGYSTALGTIPALVGSNDVVILDKLCHACLVDGARLSGATMRIFPHNDTERLKSQLAWAREKFPEARVLVVTESVFSMDGDLAPLREIVELKDQYEAWLFLDEAHGIGVLGNEGRGLADRLGVGSRIEVQMGTLGKALGSAGGYIAGSKALIEYLINRARSFIFSTAPPPAQAAASAAAIRWLETPEGQERVRRLESVRKLWASLKTGFQDAEPPESAIVPVIIGAEEDALRLADELWEEGFFVPAIRYPVVARGRARLRITLTAKHTEAQLRALHSALMQKTRFAPPESAR